MLLKILLAIDFTSIRGVPPSFKVMMGVFFVTGNQGLYASISPSQLFFFGVEVKSCFSFLENDTSLLINFKQSKC